MTSPFFKKHKRKNRRNASVIGFMNADFCSEKGDVPNEEIKYHMLVKDNLKKKEENEKRESAWGGCLDLSLMGRSTIHCAKQATVI